MKLHDRHQPAQYEERGDEEFGVCPPAAFTPIQAAAEQQRDHRRQAIIDEGRDADLMRQRGVSDDEGRYWQRHLAREFETVRDKSQTKQRGQQRQHVEQRIVETDCAGKLDEFERGRDVGEAAADGMAHAERIERHGHQQMQQREPFAARMSPSLPRGADLVGADDE